MLGVTSLFLWSVAACGAPQHDGFVAAGQRFCLSGFEWEARFGPSPVGVPSNRWGVGPSNVAETPPGLRLSLAHDGRGWLAAEVRTALPDDARRVEFEVLLEGGEVATNVVLGLFVYRDDRHELDVEASRWGAEGALLSHFALQTTHEPLTWRFDLSGAERSAHALEWGCGRV